VSVVLVVKVAGSRETSQIWFLLRLQGVFRHNQKEINNLQQCRQGGVGGQGSCQNRNVVDTIVVETAQLHIKTESYNQKTQKLTPVSSGWCWWSRQLPKPKCR
jgi:hypothetical protein